MIPDTTNDHGSHQYMISRMTRVRDSFQRERIAHAMQRAELYLSQYSPSLDYAFLLPTDTALKKSIIDAVSPVREFLSSHDLHDFSAQQQGVENKVVLDGCLMTATETFGSKVSLYRPVTKKGTPESGSSSCPSISTLSTCCCWSLTVTPSTQSMRRLTSSITPMSPKP